MSRRTRLPGALLALAMTAATAAPPDVQALPEDWYPESVAIGPDGAFYVGSWRQGAVAKLKPGAAPKARVLVKPGADGLANGQGVLVDAKHRALWVCSGNSGFTTVPQTPSALKRYDLATGAPRASYAMPDAGYCNDLAQDARGNLYVTDSFHPRVLRLAPGAAALTVWKEDPALAGEGPYKGLNGIAIDGGRDVYVSLVAASSHLLRIGLGADGQAGDVTRIEAPRVMKNVDAIRAWKPGRLVLFESNAFGDGPYGGQVTVARVDGAKLGLQTVVAGLNDPSSGAVRGDRVYFIESKYALLTKRKDGDGPVPPGVPFAIQSHALPRD
jgi:streptogramin lyase